MDSLEVVFSSVTGGIQDRVVEVCAAKEWQLEKR